MRVFQWCLALGLVVTAVAGCGGGSGGGAVSAVTRAISGELQWPTALGSVTISEVSVLEVQPGEGVSETPLATGTSDGRSYEVTDVPDSTLAMVRVTGETSGGIAVRLAAIIGQAVSRSTDRSRVTLHLAPGKTIAASAVEKMVRLSSDTSGVTPTKLAALETESDALASGVEMSAPRIDAAAVDVLTNTQNELARLDVPTYFPLAVRNSYTYAVSSSPTGPTALKTDTVGAQTTFAGTTVVPFERNDGSKAYFAPSAAAHLKVVGHQSADGLTTTVSQPPMLIPNTLAAGQPLTQSFNTIVTSPNGTETIPTSVTLTLVGYEPVTVPAGTFKHCAKLTIDRTLTYPVRQAVTSGETWYLAPGIGRVKVINSDGSGEALEHALVGGAMIPQLQ